MHLLRNKNLNSCVVQLDLKVENNETQFTTEYEKDEVIQIPIAHGEGNYYCDEETLAEI